MEEEPSQDWIEDCRKWQGVVLSGKYAHWCHEWDELPIDETCLEFICCNCYSGLEFQEARSKCEKEHKSVLNPNLWERFQKFIYIKSKQW